MLEGQPDFCTHGMGGGGRGQSRNLETQKPGNLDTHKSWKPRQAESKKSANPESQKPGKSWGVFDCTANLRCCLRSPETSSTADLCCNRTASTADFTRNAVTSRPTKSKQAPTFREVRYVFLLFRGFLVEMCRVLCCTGLQVNLSWL